MARRIRIPSLLAVLVATAGALRLEGNINSIMGNLEAVVTDVADVADVASGPSLWRIQFDPIPGMVIEHSTGRVTAVTGQAASKGVQTGWYVHKLDRYYPWSIYRWSSMISSGTAFAVTFAATPQTAFSCHNLPSKWVDSRGRGCSYYAEKQMCTSYGTEGPGFPRCRSWNLFCSEKTLDSFAYDGANAAEACCSCGGGWDPEGEADLPSAPPTKPPAQTIADTVAATTVGTTSQPSATASTTEQSTIGVPVVVCNREKPSSGIWTCADKQDWRDSLGYECSSYRNEGWCGGDSGPTLTHLRDFADDDGTSAYEACCECVEGDVSGGCFEEGSQFAIQKGVACPRAVASSVLSVSLLVSIVERLALL